MRLQRATLRRRELRRRVGRFELGASLDTGLDLLGETRFVVLGQQWVLPGVVEVEPDEVLVVVL